MRDKYELLIKNAANFGLEISDRQLEQFDKYYELLIERNEKVNLTAITEFNQVLIKHFSDSIAIAAFFDMKNFGSLIDVGTGGGFPGIPLKIMFPHLKVTLLDSLNKRIVFLDDVISALSLQNVKTLHGRAEDYGRDSEYREKYDICVSRAVANLSTLTEICAPFVRVGGLFVSYKAEKAEEEIDSAKKAIKLLGCKYERCENIKLEDNNRNFVVIGKKERTAKTFPRKAGTPGKKPL